MAESSIGLRGARHTLFATVERAATVLSTRSIASGCDSDVTPCEERGLPLSGDE